MFFTKKIKIFLEIFSISLILYVVKEREKKAGSYLLSRENPVSSA